MSILYSDKNILTRSENEYFYDGGGGLGLLLSPFIFFILMIIVSFHYNLYSHNSDPRCFIFTCNTLQTNRC